MGFNRAHEIAGYDETTLSVTYPTQAGILQIPVAEVGALPEIVYTHGAVSQKVVRFSGTRDGRWPTIPTQTGNSNEVLADSVVAPRGTNSRLGRR